MKLSSTASAIAAIKYARGIDLSRVDPSDRNAVRTILTRALQFHVPVPALKVRIIKTRTHYNISIKGWVKAIDDALWYTTFLAPENTPSTAAAAAAAAAESDAEDAKVLESALRSIWSTSTVVAPEDGESVKRIIVGRRGANSASSVYGREGRRSTTPMVTPVSAAGSIAFSDKIDLSSVQSADVGMVREIMHVVLGFSENMPALVVNVYPVVDHYNVVIKGWSTPIDDEDWYNTFLAQEGRVCRATLMDPIIATSTVPDSSDGGGGGGPPVKLLRIRMRETHAPELKAPLGATQRALTRHRHAPRQHRRHHRHSGLDRLSRRRDRE